MLYQKCHLKCLTSVDGKMLVLDIFRCCNVKAVFSYTTTPERLVHGIKQNPIVRFWLAIFASGKHRLYLIYVKFSILLECGVYFRHSSLMLKNTTPKLCALQNLSQESFDNHIVTAVLFL